MGRGREDELKRRGGTEADASDLAVMSVGGEEESVLREIRTSIRIKAENGQFKISGMTAPVSYLPSFAQGFAQGYLSAVPGHTKSNETFSTPKTAAQIDRLCTEGIGANGIPPTTPPFVALVKVIAEAKYALETSDPQGKDRDPDTKTFYEGIANRSGITIFPDKPALADAFDQAVAFEVKKLYLSKDKEFKAKMDKFESDMKIDSKNMSEIIQMLATLQPPDENNPHFNEGLILLSDILMRMMYTFSKENLELYQKDFLTVFEEIYPNAVGSEIETKIKNFLQHHTKIMVSLEKQFQELYLDMAVNTAALGLQAAAPGLTTAVAPLIGAGVTNAVQSATLGTINPSVLVGSAPSSAASLGAQDLSKFNNPSSPTRAPTRPESRAAMYARYKEEKPKQLALLGATVIAGLITGPVGAVIVGIIGGGALYAPKAYTAYGNLNALKKITDEEKIAHQKQCAQFSPGKFSFPSPKSPKQPSSTTKMFNTLPGAVESKPPQQAPTPAPKPSSSETLPSIPTSDEMAKTKQPENKKQLTRMPFRRF